MQVTCGIFLFDSINQKILCCRPFGGRKFEALSIPKGIFEGDKDESFYQTAFREFEEETGLDLIEFVSEEKIILNKTFFEFDLIEYPTKTKKLKAFLLICPHDLSDIQFTCMSYFEREDGVQCPEISEFHWLNLSDAKEKLHQTQSLLIPKIKHILNV